MPAVAVRQACSHVFDADDAVVGMDVHGHEHDDASTIEVVVFVNDHAHPLHIPLLCMSPNNAQPTLAATVLGFTMFLHAGAARTSGEASGEGDAKLIIAIKKKKLKKTACRRHVMV